MSLYFVSNLQRQDPELHFLKKSESMKRIHEQNEIITWIVLRPTAKKKSILFSHESS